MGWRVKKRDFCERRVESQSICGLIWQSPTDLRFTRAIFPQRIYVRICAIGKGLIWHTGPCESQAGWEWARDVGCDRDPNLRNVGNLFWVSHCDTTLHAQWACQGAALFAVANSGQVELFLVSCHVFDQKCVATQTEAFRFAAYACAVCLSARLLVFFFFCRLGPSSVRLSCYFAVSPILHGIFCPISTEPIPPWFPASFDTCHDLIGSLFLWWVSPTTLKNRETTPISWPIRLPVPRHDYHRIRLDFLHQLHSLPASIGSIFAVFCPRLDLDGTRDHPCISPNTHASSTPWLPLDPPCLFQPDCIVAWLHPTRFLFSRFLRPHFFIHVSCLAHWRFPDCTVCIPSGFALRIFLSTCRVSFAFVCQVLTGEFSNGDISRKSILGWARQEYRAVVLGKGHLLHVVACLYLFSVRLYDWKCTWARDRSIDRSMTHTHTHTHTHFFVVVVVRTRQHWLLCDSTGWKPASKYIHFHLESGRLV